MLSNESVYGNYRTRKLSDIYPTIESFNEDFNFYYKNGLKTDIDPAYINTVFIVINSRYCNSHISNSDEGQFKLKLFTKIYQYAPTWVKKLELQEKLRSLSDADLLIGSKMIYNKSFNPSTEPTTDTTDELPSINEQNTSKAVRSKLDAYSRLYDLLENDVTEYFIDKFKSLFIKIVQPQKPLWYITNIDDKEVIE